MRRNLSSRGTRARVKFTAGIIVTLLLAATPARPQINPGVLAEPWRGGLHRAETVDELLLFEHTRVNGTNLVTGTFYWDSYGRIKLEKDNGDPNFVIGYRALAIGFDADSPVKKGDFWDVALVGAGRLGELGDGWQLELLGGAGSANDSHWSNLDALYGVGAMGVTKPLDEQASLHGGMYYDGNRDLLPLIPLPYIAYRREFGDQFSATIGLPAAALRYQPIAPLNFTADYTFPDVITMRSALELTKHVSLFVQYARGTDAFFIADRGSERLFYSVERVNGGIRWIAKLFDASLGIGYAFDQSFSHGDDIRDLSGVSRVRNVPFLALKLFGSF